MSSFFHSFAKMPVPSPGKAGPTCPNFRFSTIAILSRPVVRGVGGCVLRSSFCVSGCCWSVGQVPDVVFFWYYSLEWRGKWNIKCVNLIEYVCFHIGLGMLGRNGVLGVHIYFLSSICRFLRWCLCRGTIKDHQTYTYKCKTTASIPRGTMTVYAWSKNPTTSI